MLFRRSLIALATAATAVSLLLAGAAPAWAITHAPLVAGSTWTCTTGAAPGTGTPLSTSYVAIGPYKNSTTEWYAIIAVSGAGAAPNTTYTFDVVSVPSGQGCLAGQFTLRTNRYGNAHKDVYFYPPPGTTRGFVVFEPSGNGVLNGAASQAIGPGAPPQ